MDILVKECLAKSPELNWLTTHILSVNVQSLDLYCPAVPVRSLQPSALLPHFLEQVFDLPFLPGSPGFTAVAQALELLSHSHQTVVAESVVTMVGKVVQGQAGRGDKWGQQVQLLLRLASLCERLLSFTSQDCLSLGVCVSEIFCLCHKLCCACSDS